jgi:DNA-binding HxlR family transcriptional regulator
MKTPTGEYSFNRAELKILKEIARGNYELSSIQTRLSIKPSLLTYTLKKLQTKGIVKFTHIGTKKQAYFSDIKHATLLKDLLSIYDHVDWENVLNGKSIEILFQTLSASKESLNVPRNTRWRHGKNFKSRGIITQEGKINPQFRGLSEFLKEYQSFFAKKIASTLSDNALILWQQDMEFLLRTQQNTRQAAENFHKTATSKFSEYGLPLFSEFDIYFYSTNKKTIRPEDIILHTLLIEPNNVRYTTYALLLLKKVKKQIDLTYLQKEAERLGLKNQITAMLQFLETHIHPEGQSLPSWEEFVIKAEDYGVMTE